MTAIVAMELSSLLADSFFADASMPERKGESHAPRQLGGIAFARKNDNDRERHAPLCAGHPRLLLAIGEAWMPAASAGMTR
jgi:hypothetical protein